MTVKSTRDNRSANLHSNPSGRLLHWLPDRQLWIMQKFKLEQFFPRYWSMHWQLAKTIVLKKHKNLNQYEQVFVHCNSSVYVAWFVFYWVIFSEWISGHDYWLIFIPESQTFSPERSPLNMKFRWSRFSRKINWFTNKHKIQDTSDCFSIVVTKWYSAGQDLLNNQSNLK